MAKEIKYNLVINIKNGTFNDLVNANGSSNQDNIGQYAPVVLVGSGAEEDLLTGDIGTLGTLVMTNLDNTNFVVWGPKSSGVMVPMGRLAPGGEPAFFRMQPGVTLRWKADTADCQVQVKLNEN